MSETFTIASGKGGVGKSVFTANLAAALARFGRTVTVVDLDIGLRSQDTLLSLENHVVYDLLDVASGDCDLSAALLPHPTVSGLSLLPAAQFARAKALAPGRLQKILTAVPSDFILLDCPAGIERGFRNALNAGADQTILLCTPDDLCLRDAERVVQVLESKSQPRPRLVVNRLDNDLIFSGEMLPARTAASLLDLELLGEIPEDPAVSRSVLRRALFVDFDCEARAAVLRIAARLCGRDVPLPAYGSRRPSLFRRFFHPSLKEVTPLDCH